MKDKAFDIVIIIATVYWMFLMCPRLFHVLSLYSSTGFSQLSYQVLLLSFFYLRGNWGCGKHPDYPCLSWALHPRTISIAYLLPPRAICLREDWPQLQLIQTGSICHGTALLLSGMIWAGSLLRGSRKGLLTPKRRPRKGLPLEVVTLWGEEENRLVTQGGVQKWEGAKCLESHRGAWAWNEQTRSSPPTIILRASD